MHKRMRFVVRQFLERNLILESALPRFEDAWYAAPTVASLRLSLTGVWYGYVSLPLYQFLLRLYCSVFFLCHIESMCYVGLMDGRSK